MKTLIRLHWCACWFESSITRTYLYNFDPLKPHFYIEKLGVYRGILKNVDCGCSLEPPRWDNSYEYPESMFWAEIWKISEFLYENCQFLVAKFSIYLKRRVFVTIGHTCFLTLKFSFVWTPALRQSNPPLQKNVYSNILKILPPKKWKISDKKFWYSSCLRSKHRLWLLVRTASGRRF